MLRRSRPSSSTKAQITEPEILETGTLELGLSAENAEAVGGEETQATPPPGRKKPRRKRSRRNKHPASSDSLTGRVRRWVRSLSRLPVLLMVACALMAVGSLQAVWHIGTGLTRSAQWQAEADELHAKNAALNEDIRVLEQARANLQTPEYLGEVARCLGFVGAGERILVAENAPRTIGSNCDTRRLP